MLVRGLLVLTAAAAIVFGATRLHDTNACNDAKREAFQVALGRGVPGGADALARSVADHCRGGSDLAATGVALARAGAVAPAERLAREAVHRDPRDYLGWVSLAIKFNEWLPPSYILVTLVTAAAATVCAALSYYLVEKPLLRFKDPKARRRRQAPRAAVQPRSAG